MKEINLSTPPIFVKYGIKGFFSTAISPQISPNLFLRDIYPFHEIILPNQVHSNLVQWITAPMENLPPCDGLLTDSHNLVIGVQTADCVPILLATKDGALIGAIHAGWRGSVLGILSSTLQKIIAQGYSPKDIVIAMGPHICTNCYEVREDVIQALKETFSNYQPFLVKNNQIVNLSLANLNLYQVKSYGVPDENVWISNDCTFCQNKLYFSYRYHRENRGYQLSFILK